MSAGDYVSPEQFGIKPAHAKDPFDPDEAYTSHGFSHTDLHIGPGQTRLRATQPGLHTNDVEFYDRRRTMLNKEKKRPVVVKHNDEHYILDGHHRLASAIKRGESPVRVEYKEL
jgi:ParB-like nuclease domain